MHKVRVWFQEMPLGIAVTFTEDNRSLGRSLRFTEEQKFHEMLRRAGAVLEDRNIAEYALRTRSAGTVELRLDEQQYASLKTALRQR
jgi:hypothetical protein